MDELREARAELARLEERAKDLLNQLLDVRFAISRQRTKINEWIRQRPPAISRLPNETLSSILSFDIRAQPYLKRKQHLASVSRLWRDIILHDPLLWSLIEFSGATDFESIKTHLARSNNVPLDIVIRVNDCSDAGSTMLSNLEIVASHSHRWQSLLVDDCTESYHDLSLGDFISDALCDLNFPSLRRVTVPDCRDMSYPIFLSQARAPALEYLEFRDYLPSNDFLPVSTLKTLVLGLESYYSDDDGHDPFPLFFSFIPTNALTTLDLRGDNYKWPFQTSSIHFPVLTTLALTVTHTELVLQAIVAPILERFDYNSWDEYHEDNTVFRDFGSTFSSVRHLVIRGGGVNSPEASLLDEIFPGVRRLELDPENVPMPFFPLVPLATNNVTHRSYPIDLWNNLEDLLVRPCSLNWTARSDSFVEWVKQRGNSGTPLHVKLTDIPVTRVTLDYLLRLYNSLKECCALEFDVPVKLTSHLVVEADLLLQQVSTFTIRNINARFIVALL